MINENLFIVIVLFNPSDEQVVNLLNLGAYYPIIAVDNTHLENLTYFPHDTQVEHIIMGGNRGIAKAQNAGIDRCRFLGAKFVLFLDQDTVVDATLPQTLLEDYSCLYSKSSSVIAIGPEVCDKETLSVYKSYRKGSTTASPFIPVPTLISSGTLMPIGAFDMVGMMEEELFIDYVDHEWCWRASSKGYICYMDKNVRIAHKVGDKTVALGGFPFLISSPFRYFYQYRNSLWLIRRHYVPLDWKMKILFRNLIGFFFVPWQSSDPWSTMKNMIKGLLIGLKIR